MKILHTVESYQPSIGGMAEVVKQISERLALLGHEVTVATSYNENRKSDNINGVKIVDFKISGNYASGIIGETEKYIDFIKSYDYDVIVNFAAQQWATDLILPMLKDINKKKVFVPTGFSGLYNPDFKDYFERMKNWMKEYDLNIFHSTDYQDVRYAKENGIENITLIPNGADEREFVEPNQNEIREELGINENAFLIFLVGSRTGLKGHLEAIEIFKKANIDNSVLLIVGNNIGAITNNLLKSNFTFYIKNIKNINRFLQKIIYNRKCDKLVYKFNNSNHRKIDNRKIIATSLNRKDTIKAFFSSDLFLLPSNIECSPIVLFEAMASKTPFLVTDVGNSAEIISWSNTGMLLPTNIIQEKRYKLSYARIDESAELLQNLYKDNSLRNQMAESGFKAWQTNYTWDKIAKMYEDVYLNLLENKTND